MTPTRDAAEFDWRIYADATCAGLAALIPLPLVDLAFEAYFRRRMAPDIAKVRGCELSRPVRRRLARGHSPLISAEGCLMLPFAIVRYIARRLWRKIIYVFAVADASSQVSEYWHRAYLFDYVMSAGHLAEGTDTDRAVDVMFQVLREADTSPVMGLARQMVVNAHRVLRLLVRARRLGAALVTAELGALFSSHWEAVEGSLRSVAVAYAELYPRWPLDQGR